MKYIRIKKNTEYQRIFTKGKRNFSSRLTVLFLPSDKMRMGICVGKKHGGAVQRNHLKRLLREIFRLHENELKDNYSYVLLPKPAEEYDYKALEKDFLYAVKKAGLYLATENQE